MRDSSLPIDADVPRILEYLREAGSLVLQAEPGAGKTTRVPPALLNAGLNRLEDGSSGKIYLLQPRRVAARAAAQRIADERGTTIGAEIGYQVRHESRVSKQTRLIACTEGIFLRRLQEDPLLADIAIVIFDEFHERSLDADMSLAMTSLVKQQIRPDLRILVMSATLDPEPVTRFLGGCPSMSTPGRTFPVHVNYLPFHESAPTDVITTRAIEAELPSLNGDLLVFLPGLNEIRRVEDSLEQTLPSQDWRVMPLYGELSLEAQQQVLKPCAQRKIILSTNIAETSLTINGVTAVIDSGLAWKSRFDASVGLNRMELKRISKASAAQRAGRAGRTAPGQCLRLWTEKEQLALSDFDEPEIARIDLSDAVLKLIAWGEHDIRNFKWLEPPSDAALARALELLNNLGALEEERLTELGKRMATLPVQPRLARLLLEGKSLGVERRAALAAALLSERSPFRRQTEATTLAYHADSDLVERIEAIEEFEENRRNSRYSDNIIRSAVKSVLTSRNQLLEIVTDLDSDKSEHKSATRGGEPDAGEALLRSIAVAFPDRICKRRQAGSERARMVGGRGVKLSDESAVRDPEFFVAVESIEVCKPDLLVKQASRVMLDWLPPNQFTNRIEIKFDDERQRVIAFKQWRFADVILEESVTSIPNDVDPGAFLAAAISIQNDAEQLLSDGDRNYLLRLRCLNKWMPELELPEFQGQQWFELIADWCTGCASISELQSQSLVAVVKTRLTGKQILALDEEAPERFPLRNGRSAAISYELEQPPVLAARIQDFFGMKTTPTIGAGRVPLLIHLLAPNYRVQQITPDLTSFWKNTYPTVKKELKGRYPKHSWPDDPLNPPLDRPRSKG